MNTILPSMPRLLINNLYSAKKRRLKSFFYNSKKRIIDLIYSYYYPDLLKAIRELGVECGDIVMVHSSFNPFNGFQGDAQDVIRAFREIIGRDGTLLMVSLPYTTSTYEYLKETTVFNVKRTMSRMGLISEIFRRQRDVLRSLHPTHPVLAAGPLAQWFVKGHETCLYPCGPESPFEKLIQKDGKVLFFDVPFNTFTFFHYLEHLIQDKLPFPLYEEEVFEVKVIDAEAEEIRVKAKAFSTEAVKKRRPEILEKKLLAAKKIKKHRIGMTDLSLVRVSDAISCVNNMAANGILFYEFK